MCSGEGPTWAFCKGNCFLVGYNILQALKISSVSLANGEKIPENKDLEIGVISQNGVCREACLQHRMETRYLQPQMWLSSANNLNRGQAGDKHHPGKNRKMNSGLSSGPSSANEVAGVIQGH